MPRHRLALEADHYRLPALPPLTITPGSFQICPSSVVAACACSPEQLAGLAQLYKEAFTRATEAARPSRHPADLLFALWN